ncbi:carboxylesterase [Aspergillus indologenus CBS 114.80]|uniref:Carboxylesterase n=1 Tax=Aspergillus indologenus CBS 114.80 TaxID=1450541 RepID=A0A2V5J373_9EURO|nr:carboxylesterase [Aspergillus indologenus CBS 114.80]
MLRNTLPTLCGLISVSSAALYETVIETRYGSVQGYPAFNSSNTGNLTHWKDITVWKGIPFAASTGGANRWKAPQPASQWNQTLDARNWGPVCPSATTGDNSYIIDEDCLNLNVWSPANSTYTKLPVGIVFVNNNYCTGPFGWLTYSKVSEEFEQIYANIKAFGGDPNHITYILYSTLTRDLIVGAIIKSGVRDPHNPLCTSLAEAYTTLDSALEDGDTYLANLEVASIAEARNLSMEALIDGATGTTRDSTIMFEAVLNYYAMPDTYLNILMKGLAHDVRVITGNNTDENGATYGLDTSLADYLEDLNETYSRKWVDRSLGLYPPNDSTTASEVYNSMFTDRSKVGTWLWTQMWYTVESSPVWNYFWDHAPPIKYKMNDYWASFIKTGNPNTQAQGTAQWPAVNASKLVQHVGNGWGQIPIAWNKKIEYSKIVRADSSSSFLNPGKAKMTTTTKATINGDKGDVGS